MHQTRRLPRQHMHLAGQSLTPQSARPQFQDWSHDNLDQVECAWHQRRWLKEFRIRYLARKFFCLWAKRTFGQVLPSKARSFYDQKIVQKSFGEWKKRCSVGRERELSLRAASHYRHFLHNWTFQAWRTYVWQQRGKRNEHCLAESHANKRKLLRTWQCWLVYVDVRRAKRGMQTVALAFRERSCLRVWWAVWRRRHYQHCTGRKINIVALQHWAQSLQLRAWLQWRELYLHNHNAKQMETKAVTHHQHRELKRCMQAWLGYLNLCRAKKLQNELAQQHHQSRIVQQCFSDWRLSWECRRRVRAHQEDIERLAARIALWRAFAHWKHYVVLCVEEVQQCELAEKHYRHHLLKLGFKGLQQNVTNTHLQQMRKNLSYRQHQVTVLQKFWNCWKSRLEEKEEEQQQALISVACARYRRVLMRQVFDTWLLKAHKQQEYRMGELRAALHFERQLLRYSWYFWRRRTAARLEEQEGLVCARDHYTKLQLQKAFCLWKQKSQDRQTERLEDMQALRFHYSKCLQKTWKKWREYVGHQREKWRKLVQADVHYQHTLLGKTFTAWKSYQRDVECILYQVAEKEKQHTRQLLRQLLCTWRENALALVCEAKAATRADEHYRRATLSKVLLQWRYAALRQVERRQQKATAVMEARKHLDKVCLQTLFLHWKELTRESLMLRAQQHRAVQHHQQHLLHKYLVKWRKYHQQCLGKMLLQRWADQLMTRRLCSASFSCWKTKLLQQQWEKQKTAQALWHWSLSLQRKAFDAWIRFTKQNKYHFEKATGVYHSAFLREDIPQVLRYAAGTRQLQGQLQAQHQQKAAYNLHQSVYRCAMQWKQKALSKKLNKPCSFLPSLKNQLTVTIPDVSPETRGFSAEEKPWPSKCSHLPFPLANVGSILSDSSTIQQARLPPWRPDLLLESPENKELLRPSFNRSEQTSVNRSSAQTKSLMPAAQTEGGTCKCLSHTTHSSSSLTHAVFPSVPPWTSDVCRAVQRPELWSPSSFIPQKKAGADMRGGQPVRGHKGGHLWDAQRDSVEKLQPNLQPHLLSSEQLVGKRNHQTAAEGEGKDHRSREEMVLHGMLEVELRHIQEQMQYYFSRKQELKSCQQQLQILQKWLGMSPQPEDPGVWEELDQLQMRINALTKAQPKERQHVQDLLARLRDIQIALDV